MILKAERLRGVHDDLVSVVMRAAEVIPFDVQVLEGLRTLERQKKLVDAGASQTMNSRHLTGHAVDLAPVLDTDEDGAVEISWHWPHYYMLAPLIKGAAKFLHIPIEWGGDWASFKDGPHWQLPWKEYP